MTATTLRDYYALLGVKPSATDDDIRHAYRRLAKMWHPDRFRSAPESLREQAERRMRQLTEANTILSNPARRSVYDRDRRLAGMPGGRYDMPKGTPLTMSSTFRIPGWQPTPDAGPKTANPNGFGVYCGLILIFVMLAALGQVRTENGFWAIIAGIFAGTAGILAFLCLTNQGPLSSSLGRYVPPEEVHAYQTRAEAAAERQHFEELVREAIDEIPEEFTDRLENLVVFVEDEPSVTVLRTAGVKPGWTLLGLYEGVPLTKQGAFHDGTPERITLFQRPIERHCLYSDERIAHQVKATLLHELAHHFGMDHDEMPIWVKA